MQIKFDICVKSDFCGWGHSCVAPMIGDRVRQPVFGVIRHSVPSGPSILAPRSAQPHRGEAAREKVMQGN